MTRPQLWVIAGPNGAGKTTLARKCFGHKIPVVNPDEIAKMAPNQIQAGIIALARRRTLLFAGADFAVETTLTGNTEFSLMRDAKANDYKVNLLYIGLRDAEQSKLRIASRVGDGGHDVPESHVMRRYARSIEKLGLAIEISNRAWIFDNSGKRWRLLVVIEDKRRKFVSRTLPEWTKRALQLV